MRWPWQKSLANRTLGDLNAEERDALESALDAGASPAELSREFSVSPTSIYQLKRQMGIGTTPKGRSPSSYNPEVQRVRAEMEEMRALAEKERLEQDIALAREERALNLELKRMELEERRRELDDDDDDDDDLVDAVVQDPVEAEVMKLIMDIYKKKSGGEIPAGGGPTTPPASTLQLPDVTVDLPRTQIREMLYKHMTPENWKMAKTTPQLLLSAFIKDRFSGITENNLFAVLQEIDEYGQ